MARINSEFQLKAAHQFITQIQKLNRKLTKNYAQNKSTKKKIKDKNKIKIIYKESSATKKS